MDFKLEICCGSADDVFAALEGGADRAELNSALFLGGLTPSIGTFRESRRAGIPIMVMVRPRDGGFCYTESEFASMLEDIQIFASEGADGLVFGVLNSDGTVDIERNRALIKAAGERQKVFHRAFDLVPDWRKAMDELVSLGFDRILTSGQSANALSGAETLKEMVQYSAGRIEILPGGGVRPHNIKDLLDYTGCTQAHSSAATVHTDTSCRANMSICFRSSTEIPEDQYSATDSEMVRALLCAIRK